MLVDRSMVMKAVLNAFLFMTGKNSVSRDIQTRTSRLVGRRLTSRATRASMCAV